MLIDDWEWKPHGIGVAKSSHIICFIYSILFLFMTIICRVFALVLKFFLALFKERKKKASLYTRRKSSQIVVGGEGKR